MLSTGCRDSQIYLYLLIKHHILPPGIICIFIKFLVSSNFPVEGIGPVPYLDAIFLAVLLLGPSDPHPAEFLANTLTDGRLSGVSSGVDEMCFQVEIGFNSGRLW
jgi:hypothetical protein